MDVTVGAILRGVALIVAAGWIGRLATMNTTTRIDR